MEIIRLDTKDEYWKVLTGDLFIPDDVGGVYMKTDLVSYDDDVESYEAVCLENGQTCAFQPDVKVHKVTAKLIVEAV